MKLGLIQNGYVLKNCKFYIYKLVVDATYKKKYAEFGVSEEDSKFILKNLNKFGIVDHLLTLYNEGYKPLGLAFFEQTVLEEIQSEKMMSYMNKYLYKKLRFLMSSQKLTAEDIRQDFLVQCDIRAFRVYPRIQNRVHLRNILRQVIHSTGGSLRDDYTKVQRNTLTRDSTGSFLSILAPLHLMPQELTESNIDNMSVSMTGSDSNAEHNWLFKQDLRSMLDYHSVTVTQSKFLNALFPTFKDPVFINHLAENVPLKFQDVPLEELHTTIMEFKPELLVQQAIDFSGIQKQDAIKLLLSVKEGCL